MCVILGPIRQGFAFSLEISHTLNRISHLRFEDVLIGLGWETGNYACIWWFFGKKKVPQWLLISWTEGNQPCEGTQLSQHHSEFLMWMSWGWFGGSGTSHTRDVSAIARSQFASFKDEETEVKRKPKLIMTYIPQDVLYIISHKSIFKSWICDFFKVKYLQRKLGWPKSAFSV